MAFIIASLFAGDIRTLLPGFFTICTRPSQFTMDYFALGGVNGAFLNTGMVGLACCGLLYFTHARCTGLTVAAYWLNVGFATFGMNFLNIWPFFLGVFVYSRIKRIHFGRVANIAMFSTALAPFASELIFRYPDPTTTGFTFTGLCLALIFGVVVGCVMPPLCTFVPSYHRGYDLYSAGLAAGLLAFLMFCILYQAPGVEVPTNTHLGDGDRLFVDVFFVIVFGACLVAGWLLDHDSIRNYARLWKNDSYKVDYIEEFGFPVTLVNFGVYGLFILAVYNVVFGVTWVDGQVVFSQARFTGATMGAIMCMFAFSAQGTQPRTVFPIVVGYALASLFPFLMCCFGVVDEQSWCLTTQAILVGMCFASGLAPVAGRYGFLAGVGAGVLHAMLVTSVPLWHGGFCLYNGGFTDGIVAMLFVPVLDAFMRPRDDEVVEVQLPKDAGRQEPSSS